MTLRSVIILSKNEQDLEGSNREENCIPAKPKIHDIAKKKPVIKKRTQSQMTTTTTQSTEIANQKAKRPKKSSYTCPAWITVGGSVLVDSGNLQMPFIAKVLELDKQKRNARVMWYYRPEDSCSGRLDFHGNFEVFHSDHKDWIKTDTILNVCTVLTFEEYENPDRAEILDRVVFFSRFFYKAKDLKFKITPVKLHCVCLQPENPDLLVIQCEDCKGWYHPKCVNIKESDVPDIETWYCGKCKR